MRHHLKTADVTTWDQLKSVFRKRYNLDDEVETKQKMYGASQRSGESCTDFALRKLELIEQCSYPEAEAEKCKLILATLSQKAKKHFFDKTFKSLDQLFDSLLRFDQVSSTTGKAPALTVTVGTLKAAPPKKQSPPVSPSRKQPPTRSGSSTPPTSSPRMSRNAAGMSQPASPSHSAQRSTPQQTQVRRLCLNCKKSGHFVTRCRQPLTQQFLEWQERFTSASQGNDDVMPLTPVRGHH